MKIKRRISCIYCNETGIDPVLYSCCGDDITDNDTDLCPSCLEHCGDEHENCESCNGTGFLVEE